MAQRRKKWDACRMRRALSRLPMQIEKGGKVPYFLIGERDRLLEARARMKARR